MAIFLPKFWTKILWYWFVYSFHLQPTSENLWRNSWIPPCVLCLHFPLCFALQILYGSPVSLCHGKISVCLRSPSDPSLPSLRCLLPLFNHPSCLYIFLLKCLFLVLCCLLAKGILKLFEYTKLLMWCYARRRFWQLLTGIWYNDKYQPDRHCCLIRVPGALYPLVFHLPFPSSISAFSHTSDSSDDWCLGT